MKKLLKSSLLTLAGLALLTNANAKTIQEGVLKVATEGTYSPYSFHDEKGELTGYDVDIAKAVADKLGLKVEFVEAPWDAMLAAFDAGKADVVFNQVSITDERKKKYEFSEPYTVPRAVLITHKDTQDIKGFDDLKGKKSAHSATSKKHGAQIVVVDGFSKGVELIAQKRADATINDDVTFLDYVKQRPNAPIKVVFTGEAIPTAALSHKDNAELIAQINKALGELKSSGKLKEISEKYFGKNISE